MIQILKEFNPRQLNCRQSAGISIDICEGPFAVGVWPSTRPFRVMNKSTAKHIGTLASEEFKNPIEKSHMKTPTGQSLAMCWSVTESVPTDLRARVRLFEF